MTVKDFYSSIGGDYEGVFARLCNDGLIQKFLLKFVNEPSYEALLKAIEENKKEDAFMAAHTLKGVAANLSLQKFHEALSKLTEQLRPCTEEADKELLEQVKVRYEEVIEGIQKLS